VTKAESKSGGARAFRVPFGKVGADTKLDQGATSSCFSSSFLRTQVEQLR